MEKMKVVASLALTVLTLLVFKGKVLVSGSANIDCFFLGGLVFLLLFGGNTRRKCVGCRQWKPEAQFKDEHTCKHCAKSIKRHSKMTS